MQRRERARSHLRLERTGFECHTLHVKSLLSSSCPEGSDAGPVAAPWPVAAP